ncbi:(2Fe-2S)-binding protein [Romboutsia sp.]|uniref:(2Fe-2S)-binding protein n=1 Tax=Romboutsia sp. TaxID=1965302 RepID=UPI002C1DF943|nr:(2Fe-2S)-binding protein [Romboutsia sp.]HSQ87621.1 (2Fe-2S)-binding protein [Romboutsia sp.]
MKLEMEKYLKVRMAQAQGARTVEELKGMSDIIIENDDELKEVEALLQNVCKCKNVSVDTVVKAVQDGADTVEKVSEVTGSGTACGRCKGIISNIIENKR